MPVLLSRKENTDDQAAAVEFTGVGLRYDEGPYVLRGLNLSLSPGSFHFLTGLSGAGKTSLLSLLYLARRPSHGVVRLFGTDVTKVRRGRLSVIRRKLGVVFQDFRLLDHLSTFDNVALPLRIAGVSESEVKNNVTELLSWVGLEEMMDHRPAILSGGQKQRVAIARAVVNRPRLILADEPTGSVDDAIGMRLMQLFIELNKLGACIVIATHNEHLVSRFGFPRLTLMDGYLKELPPLSRSQTDGSNQSDETGASEMEC